MLGLFLPPLAVAQTAQFGPLYWSASSTGAVQITTATYLAFPAVVDTLNLTITALNTTTAWTVNLYVASSPTGPWTTNCPGGTINGAAITVSPGTTLNLNCKPQGAAFLQIYVTAGTGGGQLVGSILGMNANVGALPLSGGTVGPLTVNGNLYTGPYIQDSGQYPTLHLIDQSGGTTTSIYLDESGIGGYNWRIGTGNQFGTPLPLWFLAFGGEYPAVGIWQTASISGELLLGTSTSIAWTSRPDEPPANVAPTTYINNCGANCTEFGSTSTSSNGLVLAGHFGAGGSAVTIAGTGATPTCVSGTTCLDYRGRLSIPASTTATTVTFSTAYATSPVCTVTQNGGATFFIPAWSSTTTALTITTGITLTTAEEFDYTCVQ